MPAADRPVRNNARPAIQPGQPVARARAIQHPDGNVDITQLVHDVAQAGFNDDADVGALPLPRRQPNQVAHDPGNNPLYAAAPWRALPPLPRPDAGHQAHRRPGLAVANGAHGQVLQGQAARPNAQRRARAQAQFNANRAKHIIFAQACARYASIGCLALAFAALAKYYKDTYFAKKEEPVIERSRYMGEADGQADEDPKKIKGSKNEPEVQSSAEHGSEEHEHPVPSLIDWLKIVN